MKLADEVEVDVSTSAWQVSYADAIETAQETIVEGANKETYREQDRLDLVRLRQLNGA